METGSLLEEALRGGRRGDQQGDNHEAPPSLWLDIHLLPKSSSSSNTTTDSSNNTDAKNNNIELLLELARVARRVNRFFQSKSFDWHVGGDGPIFGIHSCPNHNIPFLRGICDYGVSVVDEWAAIHCMLQFTTKAKATTNDDDSQQYYELVVECWDVQDGQILLIESSGDDGGLPVWVDRIGPEACRHRCWIRNGFIQLIAPTTNTTTTTTTNTNNNDHDLSLEEALETLRLGKTTTNVVETPPNIQQAIHQCISSRLFVASTTTTTTTTKDSLHHTAVVAVPRPVAFLIKNRPDLVNAAIVAFANHALYDDGPTTTTTTTTTKPSLTSKKKKPATAPKESNNNNNSSSSSSSNGNNRIVCEDWVFTIHSFTRTNYAMLRTLCSPLWKNDETTTHHYIPKQYQSIELKRLQRQCAVEAMPHLRHAIQIGVRLIAGFNVLLSSSWQPPEPKPTATTTLKERRALQYWPKFLQEGLKQSSNWIVESWQAGPHRAIYNLEDILECPVVRDELLLISSSSSVSSITNNNITLLSHPGISIPQQVQQVLKKGAAEEGEYRIPKQTDVDDPNEEWMSLTNETLEKNLASSSGGNPAKQQQDQQQEQRQQKEKEKEKEQTVQLDTMLKGFQSFMVDQSGVEGVAHTTTTATSDNATTKDQQLNNNTSNNTMATEEVHINPRVFLNLLQTVLDPSTKVNDIVLLPPPSTSSTEDHDDPFFSKEDYDDAMDEDDEEEDVPTDTDVVEIMAAMDEELKGTAAGSRDDNSDDAVITIGEGAAEESIHEAKILSNLLQSLEAGVGGRGPVQSMMKAMGQEPPRVSADDD